MSQKHETCCRRHCMVVYALYPFMETRVQREAEALIKHGYEVDVICPRQRGEPLLDHHNGVTIHRTAKRWRRRSGIIGQLFEYLIFFLQVTIKIAGLNLRKRYDVVQAHNVPDFLVFTALLPKLTGARVILDLHDLMPEFFLSRTNMAPDSFMMRLVRLQERISCLFADHVITVTEHWRQTLIRRGVPPEKCSVVMNLADHEVFKPVSRQKIAVEPGGQINLLYHGYIPERYGLDMVLQAMDRLRPQIPNIHFTLVGAGEYLPTLKRMSIELGLQSHIDFIPPVTVEHLPPLIAAADVAVVPYRNDSFTDSLLPTKLMEYAAMGIPAIVSRTTSISYYFNDTFVQFFTPNDVDELTACILELHTNRQRLQELSKGILQFNECHNWPKDSQEYVNTVEKLAMKGRKTHD